MDQRTMEIDEVRMSFNDAGQAAGRAERVSRLIFEHVQAMMDSLNMEQSAEIDHLDTGPIRVSFDAMDDETIARESAAEIYRALLHIT